MALDAILFNNIPGSGQTAPIFSFEVNSGGQYESIDRFVLFGHITAAGTMPDNTLMPVYDQDTVDGYCGPGSMLREMFRVASANAPAMPIWIVGVPDVGTIAAWTITIGTLPGTGVGSVQICGEEIDIVVGVTDTAATIAAALAAAINGFYNPLTKAMLPVTATAASATLTVTARHAGLIMNAVDFYVPSAIAGNIFAQPGVWTLLHTVVAAGSPTVAAALNILGDDPADYIVSPWSDSVSLGSYTTALGDVSGRWAWNRQSYGHVWTGSVSSFSGLTTFGLALNDRHMTVIGKFESVAAYGTMALPTNPAANTNIDIGGTVVTFVSASPTGNQVLIGSNLAATLASLLAMLQASQDVNLLKATYALVSSTLQITSLLPGAAGNALTISTTVSGATVSGATLAGGLNGSPHPSWLWDAGFAARVAPWLSDITTGNVSRNQTGLVVQGVLPPRDRALWPKYTAKNTLNNSGISTWRVGADGSLQVDKIVTTYRLGNQGQPDIVFRDIQTLYQVAGGLKFMGAVLADEQSNKSLALTNPGSLGALTTPSDIKATFIHAYTQLVNQGVFSDGATYGNQLVVQIDAQNTDRVNVYNPMQKVSPFDILAANATIYAQFQQAA